jgi:hypothetical protein
MVKVKGNKRSAATVTRSPLKHAASRSALPVGLCVMCCAGGKRRRGKRPSKEKRKAAGKDKDDDWDGERAMMCTLPVFLSCAGYTCILGVVLCLALGPVSCLARTSTMTGTVRC